MVDQYLTTRMSCKRLVGPDFVLMCFPHQQLSLFSLAMPTSLYVLPPEGSEISIQEGKVILQFPLFASEGKADKGKECNMAKGTVKVFLKHFGLKYLRICVLTDHI